MLYQEASPKFWFVSRVDNLLTIGDRQSVVPPVTSIRGLLKKQEVKTKAHSNVQLTAPRLPVSF